MSTKSENDPIAEKLWKEDMEKMGKGTRLLFKNDFTGAEATFKEGMNHHHEIAETNTEVR
eukprot:CAMPEP_0204840024 /NCGR_PEP_ID=MMETSP1346-20131115/36082_1 /ASSEMBLY_ACC=CAM_ASM_000771 /TAXON_ID=215587 /ORGANISM="Aplanochytrium stocchinoi, Strain GSBS06" /LENGTH=59 /DNA_ID=CAMNT_0051977145 /DNA_START=30 /DNA_END=205 /DNA_ORIENTATION=+